MKIKIAKNTRPVIISLMTIISIIQLILSVLLVAAILFQRSEAGLGGALGGGGGDMGGGVQYTRRGIEKTLFQATIILAVLFVLTAVAALVI